MNKAPLEKSNKKKEDESPQSKAVSIELATLQYLIAVANDLPHESAKRMAESVFGVTIKIKTTKALAVKKVPGRLQAMIPIIISGGLKTNTTTALLINYLQDYYSGKKDLERQRLQDEATLKNSKIQELSFKLRQLEQSAVSLSEVLSFLAFISKSIHDYHTNITDLIPKRDRPSETKQYNSLIKSIESFSPSIGSAKPKPVARTDKMRQRKAKSKT